MRQDFIDYRLLLPDFFFFLENYTLNYQRHYTGGIACKLLFQLHQRMQNN